MKVGFLRAMIREVQWLTSNLVLDSVQSEMAIYPDLSISDHQQSWGYEDGPLKGPGPPLLVAADF